MKNQEETIIERIIVWLIICWIVITILELLTVTL